MSFPIRLRRAQCDIEVMFMAMCYKTNPVSFQFYCRMRYVAAYLLAVLGGKEAPSSADIEKILSSVGIEADGERLKKVVGDLAGKSIDELIEEGRGKLSSMPSGGGAVAAAPAAAAGAAAPAAEAKKGLYLLYLLLC